MTSNTPPADLEVNTFTLLARCERTGRFGIGITTRTISVGHRCFFIRPPYGIMVSQAFVHTGLALLGARLLEMGYPAAKVLQEIESSEPFIEFRQIGIIDAGGNAVARTGRENKAWAGHISKPNYVAMGNVLLGEHVAKAMADAFEQSSGEDLDERLLRAIEAGRDAGGQHKGQRSATLTVYGAQPFPVVDLRVDDHPEPIGELRRIYELTKPLRPYYERTVSSPVGLPLWGDWLEAQQRRG